MLASPNFVNVLSLKEHGLKIFQTSVFILSFALISQSRYQPSLKLIEVSLFSYPKKESYDQLSILKSRGFTLSTKVHLVKAMVFPVVMSGCESWTIKKAECQRIDAFELWYWRCLLRVPWTARRSNQSILKEISPYY